MRSESYEDPKSDAEKKEIDVIAMKETIDTFSGIDREILLLQLIGYKAGEIAVRLGLEPEEVYRRLERIWKKLREKTVLKK